MTTTYLSPPPGTIIPLEELREGDHFYLIHAGTKERFVDGWLGVTYTVVRIDDGMVIIEGDRGPNQIDILDPCEDGLYEGAELI